MTMNAQEENRKSSSGSRRQEVIKEELSRISSGRPSTGHTSKSLRSTVRTVIAQELQNVLAKDSLRKEHDRDFIRECLELQAVRDAQGVPPLKRSSCRSAPSLHEPPFVVKHGEFTRKILCSRGVGGVLQKCPPPWSNETSTAPVLPSKYRELSWWLWASVNPEYQIYPEVVEMRNAYPWHKDAGPDTRIFMNPKDDFIEYRRAKFQPGNKLTMRTGSGSMSSKA